MFLASGLAFCALARKGDGAPEDSFPELTFLPGLAAAGANNFGRSIRIEPLHDNMTMLGLLRAASAPGARASSGKMD